MIRVLGNHRPLLRPEAAHRIQGRDPAVSVGGSVDIVRIGAGGLILVSTGSESFWWRAC